MIHAQLWTVKGVEELVSLFDSYGSVDGYLSCVIAILYFGTVYSLEKIGSGVLAKPWARGLLADYAYPVKFPPTESKHLLMKAPDQHNLLGWLCSYPRHLEKSKHQHSTHHPSVLSYAATWLVDRLLDSGHKVDLRCYALRVLGDAPLLL